MYGLDLVTVAGLLVLAGNTVQCGVPQSPRISVTPSTAPIRYEFALSGEELSQFQSGTVNPYAPGTDTATGGLRRDQPKTNVQVKWGSLRYPDRGVVCLWYDAIDITIELSPVIYVANENDSPACRAAIVEHEQKHVAVDRTVTNRYAQAIGDAVKTAVDVAGAMGPFNEAELDVMQERLVKHVHAVVEAQDLVLHQDMARNQAKIDTLEEYERVSKICNEGAKK